MVAMQEPMDIYDAAQQPTGTVIDRFDVHLHEGQYLQYVLAVVQDLQGRFLITRRALDKGWGAGWWETTGGGVRAGETSRQAVLREVEEETGLHVAGCEPELVYSYCNDEGEGGDNYFMDVYRFRIDFTADEVNLQASEAIDSRIVSWEQIVELHEQGVFLHFSRLARALGKE